MSSTCPRNTANFGPLVAEIHPVVWGTKISTGFVSWQRYCTASSSGHQPNFAALNRGRHLFGRATIGLGIGPHSGLLIFYGLFARLGFCHDKVFLPGQ